MNSFFISKRKTFELGILLVLDAVLFLILDSWDFIALFSLGFVWNWVATQEKSIIIENNRRYRFSTLKTVFNLQNLCLKPLSKAPEPIKFIARLLPAGLFWSGVILFIDSPMPWWAVFLGSLLLELIILETKIFSPKQAPP
jgi:hypothetical protein